MTDNRKSCKPAEDMPLKEKAADTSQGSSSAPAADESIEAIFKNSFLQNAEAIKAMQQEFISYYSPFIKSMGNFFHSSEWTQIAETAAALQQNAQIIKTQLKDVIRLYELITKEIEKPQYEGLSADKLEEMAADPEADPKYKQLWQQAVTAAQEAMRLEKEQQPQEATEQQPQETESKEGKTGTPREKAIERGALMSIGGHITSFSAEDLQNTLTNTSIFKLPGATTDFAFDAAGQLNTLSIDTGQKQFETLQGIHTAFLMAIVQFFWLRSNESGNGLLEFYVPTMCRDLGIDPREYSSKRKDAAGQEDKATLSEMRMKALLELMSPFDPLVGKTADGNYYRVLTFHQYDPESETMTISAPYITKLLEIANNKNLSHSPLNQLFHGNVVNERNHAAVELANRILAGLLRRGDRADYKTYTSKPQKTKQIITKTDAEGNKTTTTTTFKAEQQEQQETPKTKKITYQISFQSLIADCPQLKSELEAIKNSKKDTWRQAYNSKLKQTFEAAFRIILEKSDALDYYIDFDYSPKHPKTKKIQAPTVSTMGRKLTITHKGKNRNYSPIVM